MKWCAKDRNQGSKDKGKIMMSEARKLRRSRDAFRQFIIKACANPARNVSPWDRDAPMATHDKEISRQEMLDAFLTFYPELKGYRTQLATEQAVMPNHWVNSIAWQQLF